MLKKLIWLMPLFWLLTGCATKPIELTQEQASKLPILGQVKITLPDEKKNKIKIVNIPSLFVVYRSADVQDYKKHIYLFIRMDNNSDNEYIVKIPAYSGYTVHSMSLLLQYQEDNDSTIYANAGIDLNVIYNTDRYEIEKLKRAKHYHNGDSVEFIFNTMLQPDLKLENFYFYTDQHVIYGSGLSSV